MYLIFNTLRLHPPAIKSNIELNYLYYCRQKSVESLEHNTTNIIPPRRPNEDILIFFIKPAVDPNYALGNTDL